MLKTILSYRLIWKKIRNKSSLVNIMVLIQIIFPHLLPPSRESKSLLWDVLEFGKFISWRHLVELEVLLHLRLSLTNFPFSRSSLLYWVALQCKDFRLIFWSLIGLISFDGLKRKKLLVIFFVANSNYNQNVKREFS